MSTFTCEKCKKEFTSQSQYTKHENRKTPCVKKQKENVLTTTTTTPITVASPTIDTSSFEELKQYYDSVLNADKTTYQSTNDEPTPIDCVQEMISKLLPEFWARKDLRVLDPCCGNGNFHLPIFFELIKHHNKKYILESILEFNDINTARLENVCNVFCGYGGGVGSSEPNVTTQGYKLQITNNDYITHSQTTVKYDLIVANPPYAKLLENGKRASKNHNLIKDFIEKALSQLKPNGYLLFITPDNWMSYADRNTLIETITTLQILYLDIHTAKKYFKKIGSSFTWYIIENCPSYKNIQVSGIWKKVEYTDSVISTKRNYIPLLWNKHVQSILAKTVDNTKLPKFDIQTSSDLHKYTKKEFIHTEKTDVFRYKLIHTPNQTVYASRPHKYQDGYKVFISTTDKYKVFVDQCGMTQSIVFLRCENEDEANFCKSLLEHPLYVFINNICRWGNFNNIRILQHFPRPDIREPWNQEDIYRYFGITEEEKKFIENSF